MRRPLLAMAFCMTFGVVLARYTETGWWQLSLVLCGCGFVVYPRQKRTRVLTFACVLFLAFGFVRMREVRSDDGAFTDCEGSVVTLEGVVTSAKIKNGYSAVIVKVKTGEQGIFRTGRSEKILVRLATEDVEYVYSLPGRMCSFCGEVSLPDGMRNPGCFDYAQYLKGRGINVICSVSQYRFEGGRVKNGPLNWLSATKGKFFKAAMKIVPEDDFGVLAGLIFGDKSFMDEEQYAEFQNNGIAHVLAVSGLHVGLVYELIIRLFGENRGWKTTLLIIVSLFVYAALADFSVSVMRAAVMIMIRLLAVHLKRRYDLVTAASLSAIIFMTINPYQLLDPGFQLSFIAAYTMGICMPWAEVKVQALADRYRKEWIEKAGNAVLPAVLIQLGMMPLTLYHFCLFSPFAILLNPIAIFLAGLILAAGLAFFGVFICLGEGLLFAGAAGPAQYLCRALALLSRTGARACGGFAAAAPPLAAVVVYYLLFFYFFSETRYVLCRRGSISQTLTLGLALAAAGCLIPYAFDLTTSPLPWKYNDYPVTFLDVGQGDCIHIKIDGKNILVDGGGAYGTNIASRTLKPYLLKNGAAKLDLAIVTHSDGDHSRGIQQLSEEMEIDCIAFPCCYEDDEKRLSAYTAENRIFMNYGDELRISEDASLFILAPAADASLLEDENKNCLVMMLVYRDLKVLLTSDMDTAGELALMKKTSVKADILKLAHHGSEYSSCEAFVNAVDPSFAVISCGKNNSYGHPHAAVVDLLEKSDIIYGRTDRHGAVCLRSFSEDGIILENASKDTKWLIQRETDLQGNTPPKP